MKKEEYDSDDNDVREEYDFSGGVRGKHYKAYRKGHTVHIHRSDGTTLVQYFTQEDGTVMLDPDIKVHFPAKSKISKRLPSVEKSEIS